MRRLLITLALGLAAATGLQAQAWPSKPVTLLLLLPFPPAASADLIARTIAPQPQARLGGSFIVENKARATGTVGTGLVERAAPDGYTIFVSSPRPFVIAPNLIKSVTYDALKDSDCITVAVQAPKIQVGKISADGPHAA